MWNIIVRCFYTNQINLQSESHGRITRKLIIYNCNRKRKVVLNGIVLSHQLMFLSFIICLFLHTISIIYLTIKIQRVEPNIIHRGPQNQNLLGRRKWKGWKLIILFNRCYNVSSKLNFTRNKHTKYIYKNITSAEAKPSFILIYFVSVIERLRYSWWN